MPLDEFEVEEEDEETQRLRARKQPVSVRSILAYIPILGWILNWIIGFFVRKINEVYVPIHLNCPVLCLGNGDEDRLNLRCTFRCKSCWV